VTPEDVKVGMWLALSLAVVATALLTTIVCYFAWWRLELPDSVQRLVDRIEHYHEVKRLAGAAEAAGYAPPTGMLDQAERDLAAALEEALAEVGLQPLALPYPKQVALAAKVAEWAAGAGGRMRVMWPTEGEAERFAATVRAVGAAQVKAGREPMREPPAPTSAGYLPIGDHDVLADRDAVNALSLACARASRPWAAEVAAMPLHLFDAPCGLSGPVTRSPEQVTCQGCLDFLAKLEPPAPIMGFPVEFDATMPEGEAVLRGSNPETSVGFVPRPVLSREEQVAASPIQRVIESELRNPDIPKWQCEECDWEGDEPDQMLTASDGQVGVCPDCGDPDTLAVRKKYYDWVNAQFEAPEKSGA
jgi:hypothetical protein